MQKYILSPQAIKFLLDDLKTTDGCISLMQLLDLKEQQIKNVILANQINGRLTSVPIVNYIKTNSDMPTESKILKEVK